MLNTKELHLLRKRLWHQWAPAVRQTSDPQFYDFQKGCLPMLATAYVLPKSLCWYFLKIFAFGLVSFFNFLLISSARCSDRKANAWSPKQRCVIATEWQLSALSECSSPNKFSLISRTHWWDSRLTDNYLKSFVWPPQNANFELCPSVPHRITFVLCRGLAEQTQELIDNPLKIIVWTPRNSDFKLCRNVPLCATFFSRQELAV